MNDFSKEATMRKAQASANEENRNYLVYPEPILGEEAYDYIAEDADLLGIDMPIEDYETITPDTPE